MEDESYECRCEAEEGLEAVLARVEGTGGATRDAVACRDRREARQRETRRRAARCRGRVAAVVGQQAEIDNGHRAGTTTEESEELKVLRQEVKELRRANSILKSASAFFAAELDRPSK